MGQNVSSTGTPEQRFQLYQAFLEQNPGNTDYTAEMPSGSNITSHGRIYTEDSPYIAYQKIGGKYLGITPFGEKVSLSTDDARRMGLVVETDYDSAGLPDTNDPNVPRPGPGTTQPGPSTPIYRGDLDYVGQPDRPTKFPPSDPFVPPGGGPPPGGGGGDPFTPPGGGQPPGGGNPPYGGGTPPYGGGGGIPPGGGNGGPPGWIPPGNNGGDSPSRRLFRL